MKKKLICLISILLCFTLTGCDLIEEVVDTIDFELGDLFDGGDYDSVMTSKISDDGTITEIVTRKPGYDVGKGNDVDSYPQETTDNPQINTSGGSAGSWNVSPTAAGNLMNQLTSYSSPDGRFTCTAPGGWSVSTGGSGSTYWIRIYDPQNPVTQVFSQYETANILNSQETKNFYKQYEGFDMYRYSAEQIVVTKVEDLYSHFPEYATYTRNWIDFFDSFVFPEIYDFKPLDKFQYNAYAAMVAFDSSIVHGSFCSASGQQGEGFFTGSLCTGNQMNNIMYNINGISAPYGQFSEYEQLLKTVFGSIQYTNNYFNELAEEVRITADMARSINATLQQTSDIVVNGWNECQKTYDAISEKQSDATMGYDRVYDTQTGDVYKASVGLMDNPDFANRFQMVTDNSMYAAPVAGIISR